MINFYFMAQIPQSSRSPLDYESIRVYMDRIKYKGALLDLPEIDVSIGDETAPATGHGAVSSLSMDLLTRVRKDGALDSPIQLSAEEIALANVLDD